MLGPPDVNVMMRQRFDAFCRKLFATINPAEPFLDNWHLDAMMH